MKYEFLDEKFLEAMNDIGRLGFEKYKDASFHAKRMRGDRSRDNRLASSEIAKHAKEHFDMYLGGAIHDKFLTRKHQLAAVEFNALMEYHFANLEQEGTNVSTE